MSFPLSGEERAHTGAHSGAWELWGSRAVFPEAPQSPGSLQVAEHPLSLAPSWLLHFKSPVLSEL